ncbi:MAG TPA: hypothetical protein VE978_00775 [Chitinophagales bacterium]|nr:hypothetical protein [Chitinophagales bacterium]
MFVVITCYASLAQDATTLPETDIYLLDIGTDKRGNLLFENPVRITKNEGYDNEPWFYPDGSAILYSAVRDTTSRSDTLRADIYKYNLNDQKITAVIRTPRTSEFSPMIPPNKIGVSVVRVLEDDTSQVLARCIDKQDDCDALFPKIRKVGYYIWVDPVRVAMVIVSDPAILVVANLTTGKVDTIAEDVGQCLQKLPGKNLQIAFVDKGSNPWTIKLFDGKSGKVSGVVPTLEDQQDFCFMPDGSLLMGSGSKLYHYVPPVALATTSRQASSHATTPGKGAAANSKNVPAQPGKPQEKKVKKNDNDTGPWEEVADFKGTAVYQFYRLAVSPKGNKLAVVTYLEEKPE